MKKQTSIEQTMESGVAHFRIKGKIDEYADAALMSMTTTPAASVVMNFKDVIMVNSTGLRSWHTATRELTTSKAVEYRECSPCVVDAINTVVGLIKGVHVTSVYAPFVCRKCAQTALQLIPLNKTAKPSYSLADRPCPTCKGETRPEVDADYFEFLEYAK